MKKIQKIAERSIKTLKNEICKHVTAVSKCWIILILLTDIEVLDDIFDQNNNIHHNTTKRKPIDVNSHSYAEYDVDSKEGKS